MHYIAEGRTYTMDTSDLKVYIHKIYYRSPQYYKAKVSIINKHNGVIYETRQNYKLYPKLIKHWENTTWSVV